jgi:hypothetical protein
LLALQDDDGNQHGAEDNLGNTQICLHKTLQKLRLPLERRDYIRNHFPIVR